MLCSGVEGSEFREGGRKNANHDKDDDDDDHLHHRYHYHQHSLTGVHTLTNPMIETAQRRDWGGGRREVVKILPPPLLCDDTPTQNVRNSRPDSRRYHKGCPLDDDYFATHTTIVPTSGGRNGSMSTIHKQS